MRLICPNCQAQYEVGEGVIPPEGRDVQCSNCGETWFQAAEVHPAPESAHVDEATADDLGEATQEPATQADMAPDQAAAQATEAASEPQADPVEPPAARAPGSLSPEMPTTVSAGAADILREEAERERRQRSAERQADPLESQPDLGLSEERASRARAARERMARVTSEPRPVPPRETSATTTEDDVRQIVSQMVSSNRDLLPDIEEINSTLTATSVRKEKEKGVEDGEAEQAAVRRKSGFRLGFAAMIVFWAVAVGAYAFAPLLSEQIPGMAPALASYADWADGARVWLDGWVKSSVENLTEMMSAAVAET